MHGWQNVDWSAVVAALIALWNAFQHQKTQRQIRANHAETASRLRMGGV